MVLVKVNRVNEIVLLSPVFHYMLNKAPGTMPVSFRIPMFTKAAP